MTQLVDILFFKLAKRLTFIDIKFIKYLTESM